MDNKHENLTEAIKATLANNPTFNGDDFKFCPKCDGYGELQPNVTCPKCEGTGIKDFEEGT